MRTRLPLLALALLALLLPACGKRSVRVRNDTDRTISIRLVHDAFLSGERTLDSGQIAAYQTGTYGPFTDVPLLDPIDLEVSLAPSIGDLPQKYRIDKRNVSLVVEPSVLESWSGFVIRRDDKRFK
jgi:hypothetical protein